MNVTKLVTLSMEKCNNAARQASPAREVCLIDFATVRRLAAQVRDEERTPEVLNQISSFNYEVFLMCL
jgi:hypothetical protein